MIAAIISVFGAAVLAMFGYFMQSVRADMQSIRADLRDLGVQINTRIDGLEERVNTLEISVAAIAATQAEHGVMLQHVMGHGGTHQRS